MYLQHCRSQQSTDRAKSIFFYALWVLYALNMATMISDILELCWPATVSMDDHCSLTLFQLVLQKIEIQYPLDIIQATNICFL